MNKKAWIIISIILVLIIGIAIYMYFNNSNTQIAKNNNYEANRTSATNNTTEEDNNQGNSRESNENKTEKGITEPTEEQISTFSTKIYSNDPSRQHNIELTCNRLNGAIVKNGETFSFYQLLGPSTKEKGYLEADILDNKGKKQKGFGGGNCQISSTLYNAVLLVPTLVVTERHEHSNYVPYIEKGKDAAVSYGSYDLKFRNDSGNDVKILTSTDGVNVTATLMSIKQ